MRVVSKVKQNWGNRKASWDKKYKDVAKNAAIYVAEKMKADKKSKKIGKDDPRKRKPKKDSFILSFFYFFYF